MKRKYLFILFQLLPIFLLAQNNGQYAFTFLEQPVSARTVALGGKMAAIYDNDITLGFVNPSLINDQMNNDMALSYVNFFAGVNYGLAQYSRTFNHAGSFLASLQYINYGKFVYANTDGTVSGTFGAADYNLNIGWGRQLGPNFSIGASGKLIYSYYETYQALGLAVDVAGTYRNENGWTFSLVASNIGTQLKGYVSGVTSPLPFDIQAAVSKRLEHVPLRLCIGIDHMEKWNLSMADSLNPAGGIDPLTGNPVHLTGVANLGDKLMRHFIFGGELYLGKNLTLRAGYNYLRRKELTISERQGLVGFSWGIGIRISHFQINYARTTYHMAGSPNYFTLATSLDSFGRGRF
ncbi:MAG: type IX secretion system protein PorQ [Bacteroidales bacterium]|nr:type IX secretion system protein PorQ [Bacteroidales bacterium]